jgi:mannose-P-dolichol utilization defect 1
VRIFSSSKSISSNTTKKCRNKILKKKKNLLSKKTRTNKEMDNIDFKDLSKNLSSIISTAIIAGSFALKIPQIITILRNKSAAGVSLSSNLVEALGFAVSASWGYSQDLPFKSYGEAIVILAQVAVVCLLIGFFNKQLLTAIVGLAVVGALGAALTVGMIPVQIHEALMGVQILFVAFSRGPQIVMNQANKKTGALSFTTFFLSFGGAGARAFTTLVSVPMEKGKLAMFANAMVSCSLNAVIVLQIFVYGPNGKKAKLDDEEGSTTKTTRGTQLPKASAAPANAAVAAATATTTTSPRASRVNRKTV